MKENAMGDDRGQASSLSCLKCAGRPCNPRSLSQARWSGFWYSRVNQSCWHDSHLSLSPEVWKRTIMGMIFASKLPPTCSNFNFISPVSVPLPLNPWCPKSPSSCSVAVSPWAIVCWGTHLSVVPLSLLQLGKHIWAPVGRPPIPFSLLFMKQRLQYSSLFIRLF